MDYNSDGHLDIKWYYKGGRQSRTEVDRNRDGEPDVITEFTTRGLTYSERYDDNFNGIFEGSARFHYGNPIRLESDTDEDGHIDYKVLYENGVPKKAVITDGTADSPTKIQHFEMGKLVEAKVDSDGDGVFDVVYEYDWFEEPSAKKDLQ